jgi:hypothetical protein
VFKLHAARGKSSTGWFYGFKLHLVINDQGEICSFCLTAGNVDDRNLDVIDRLCRELSGKLFGDRGYISQALFEHLYQQGIQQVEHSRQRSVVNFLVNLLAALSAYSFLPHKPSIHDSGDVRALPVFV